MVYVLNKDGKTLMPTKRYGHVRKLLRDGNAVVVRNTPFTIQLTQKTRNYVQDINLGIDIGSKHIGVSATTKEGELYAAQVDLRTDITKLIASRKEARRARRSRLRYRAPRIDNRTKSGLHPSMINKIDAHLKIIRLVHSILPIKQTILEIAKFDISSLGDKNNEKAKYWNLREYILARDNHVCQYCKGKTKDVVLHVHHIESRQTGGNSANNLITLCKTCHNALHRGEIKMNMKRGLAFRDMAHMNYLRERIVEKAKEEFGNIKTTFGYITKQIRIANSIPKSHTADARCISGNPTANPIDSIYKIKQVRRHNRQIHKAKMLKGGIKKRNQAPYIVCGFRLFDKVLYNNKECFIFGRRLSGSFDLRTIDGCNVNHSVSSKKIKFLETRNTFLTIKT